MLDAIATLPLKDAELFRQANYIGGKWVRADSGKTITVRNPATGEPVGEVPAMGAAETRRAIEAAHAAQPAWRAMLAKDRAAVLRKLFELMLANTDDLAAIMTAEQGKPLAESRGEVARVVDFCEWMGGQAAGMGGITAPSEDTRQFAFTLREPLGVVGLITPWNFPLNIPSWKIASALLHGNTVVLKAADLTARCAQELVRCYEEGGVPAGALNLVTGSGRVVGGALADDPAVAAVSFTGSTAVGLGLAQRLAARGAKAQCEMGGSNPVVVLDDADLDRVVADVTVAAFGTSGQRCTAARRVVATPAVHDELVERLDAARAALTVGPGEREGVDVGPLCDPAGLRDVLGSVQRAREEAGDVRGGDVPDGELADGLFIRPALVVGVAPEMELGHEEVFGPVLAIQAARDYEDALRIANATEYGLSASIFTADMSHALDFARRSRSGMVHLNKGPIGGESHLPFGGARRSSFGPKEMGAAREFFTQGKTVYADIRLD
jgi:acyl-CoA reductase-like NAD-dependent aldehyde dehydrogenase